MCVVSCRIASLLVRDPVARHDIPVLGHDLARVRAWTALALGLWLVCGGCGGGGSEPADDDHGAADGGADAAEPVNDGSGDRLDLEPDALDAGVGDVELDAGGADAALPDPDPTESGDDYLRFDGMRADADGLLRVPFRVPAEALSFSATVDPGETPRSIALIALIDRRGEWLFDFTDEEADYPYRPASPRNVYDALPYTMTFPNAPDQGVGEGRYEVIFYVDPPSDRGQAPVDVDVVFQLEPESGTLPRVEVALWFAPGASLDADAAFADPDFGDAVDSLVAIYREGGLGVSDVRYGDITGDSGLADVDSPEALASLVGTLAESPDRTLPFIFVEHLEPKAGQALRVRTTGIPGAPAHPELARRSAVVIALDRYPASIRRAGEMLAHEGAHLLGLAHTTEYDGERHDPIDDTPECPAERASQATDDGTMFLIPADCADLDGYNLLFHTAPRESVPQRELTAGQGVVMSAHPSVRWTP